MSDKMDARAVERMMKKDKEQLKQMEKKSNQIVGKIKGGKGKGRIF